MMFTWRTMLHALAIALILTLLITVAFGGASPMATVSWIAPTAYIDGTPLKTSDVDHYTLTWTGAGGGSVTVKSPGTSAVVPVACGVATFSVTVTSSVSAVYPNTTSLPTPTIAFDSKVSCTPNPPTGLAVH